MERAAHPSPWVERVSSQSESLHKYQPRFSELLSPQYESLKPRHKGKKLHWNSEHHGACLNLFRQLEQTVIEWVSYEQQKFISHSSGKSKIKAPTYSVSGENAFLAHRQLSSLCNLTWWGLFYKDTNFILEDSPLLTYTFQGKAPPPNTIILEIRISVYQFPGDTNIQPVTELQLRQTRD